MTLMVAIDARSLLTCLLAHQEVAMPVTEEQYRKLLEFDTGSWAVWSPEFNRPGCIESTPHAIQAYVEARFAELKNTVVLLGLNRSYNTKRESKNPLTDYPRLSNFHRAGHPGDGLLKTVISALPNLQGAYMTDLTSDLESRSKRVTVDKPAALQRLNEQFDILQADQLHVVCFGEAVFSTLTGFKWRQLDPLLGIFGVATCRVQQPRRSVLCYGVIHYSYAVRFNQKARFARQMQTVNHLISGFLSEVGS